MTFVYNEKLPANPFDKDQWSQIDTSATTPVVEAEAFLLECNTKIWEGPLCRSRFLIAPDIGVTTYYRKPRMEDLPRIAAETRSMAIHIWDNITGNPRTHPKAND